MTNNKRLKVLYFPVFLLIAIGVFKLTSVYFMSGAQNTDNIKFASGEKSQSEELGVAQSKLPKSEKSQSEETKDNHNPLPQGDNCYDGVCFEGEVEGNNLVTYQSLVNSFNNSTGLSKTIIPNVPEYSHEIIYKQYKEELSKGGIWLKFKDSKYTRNGKPRTYYVSKKPIINNISWEDLYRAGMVYGWDMVDTNGKLKNVDGLEHLDDIGSWFGDESLNKNKYQSKIIDVDGEKYIVRLLRGKSNYGDNVYGDSFDSNNPNSEWNRTIIPIIHNYRFGKGTDSIRYAEKALRIGDNANYYKKIYEVQTAAYNWFGDLTLGASDDFIFKGKFLDSVGRRGQVNWTQEFAWCDYGRLYRGYNFVYQAAAESGSTETSSDGYYLGARLVLEPFNN